MAEMNEIFTRLQLKHDTYAAWDAVKNTFRPLPGEICVVEVPSGSTAATTAPTVLFKVGQAKSSTENYTFAELPWASALAADVYSWAKKTEAEFITWVNGQIEHPVLSVVDPDATTKKFITKIDVSDHQITVTRADIEWDDVTKKPEFDTIYKRLQTVVSKEGSTSKTITKVEQDAQGVVTVTYGDIAFPKVTIPDIAIIDDTQVEVPTTETVNVYKNLTENGHTLTEELVEVATKKAVDNALAAAKDYADKKPHENTAHTHSDGSGTKVTAAGGINGDVAVNLNIAMELDENQNIIIYDKDDTTKTALASMPASTFIKDGMLDDVAYDATTNTLTFTWNTDAGQKTDTVTLSDILDPYSFEAGAKLDVDVNGTKVTYSHEVVAAPTKSAGSGREYLTGVTTDGYGHITGFTTATEVDDGVLEVTASGDNEVDLKATEENGVVTITAAHTLHVAGEAKTASTATISGYSATGEIKIPKLVTNDAGHIVELAEETVTIVMPAEQTIDIPDASGSAVIASVSNDIVTLKTGAVLKDQNGDHVLANDNGTDIELAKIAKTGSIYDVKEGANDNTGSDKVAHPKYLIFNCGSSTTVI